MNGRTAIVLLVAVFLVSGCEPEPMLVVRKNPSVPDVPVPSGFRFDPTDSTDFTSETTNERYVNYHYTGRALFADVVSFYKRYMPVEGWRLQQDVGTGGRQTLHFKKSGVGPVTPETPTCIITVFGSGEYANAIRFQRMEKQGTP